MGAAEEEEKKDTEMAADAEEGIKKAEADVNNAKKEHVQTRAQRGAEEVEKSSPAETSKLCAFQKKLDLLLKCTATSAKAAVSVKLGEVAVTEAVGAKLGEELQQLVKEFKLQAACC